jgi:hypothetical protein
MKPLMQFSLCCLLAPGLFAADHGGGHGGSVAAGHNAGHAHGSIQSFGHGRRGGYLYGGFYDPYYDYGDSPAAEPGGSNVTVVYPPSAPAVMVTETAHPVIHEYAQPEDYGTAAERGNQPILYLIAFRDSTIRAAMTYWVEGGTLHYLDTGHKEKEAPLASVDLDLSGRLNRERHVPFNIQ